MPSLPRLRRFGEVPCSIDRRLVDLDQFQVIRACNHVVRDASRLRQAVTRMQRYLARVAGEAKCDRSAQDVKEMCRNVMPVPARGLRHRLEGANLLRADATAGCGSEPEVAVLG